jgi:hypothetical protein|tara:strand:- start:465 stop:701 length:237 start_codon:yes stop_codon:yes gene_type:complete
MKHSTTEELTLNYLVNTYGRIREAYPKNQVETELASAKRKYQYETEEYAKNQSSFNYNNLIDAMIRLQYWNQKRATRD